VPFLLYFTLLYASDLGLGVSSAVDMYVCCLNKWIFMRGERGGESDGADFIPSGG
jgi:hypothetical protein